MQYRIQDTIPYAPGKLSYYQIILQHRQMYEENAILQMTFIHDHHLPFFESVERVVLPKILGDISLLIKNRWAMKLSSENLDAPRRHDFYHCHILSSVDMKLSGSEAGASEDMDRLVSSVSILYHTREYREEYTLPEHNILSTLCSEPRSMDPKISESNRGLRAVNHLDLGMNHVAQINFQAHRKGAYTLGDGTKLDMRGVLDFDPIQERKP